MQSPLVFSVPLPSCTPVEEVNSLTRLGSVREAKQHLPGGGKNNNSIDEQVVQAQYNERVKPSAKTYLPSEIVTERRRHGKAAETSWRNGSFLVGLLRDISQLACYLSFYRKCCVAFRKWHRHVYTLLTVN